MPELVERPELFTPKSLNRRVDRQNRALVLSRASHAGQVVLRLAREERNVCRTWDAVETELPFPDRIRAYLDLSRVLDTIRERRRIVLGIPLPGKGNVVKQLTAMPALIDVAPMPVPHQVEPEPSPEPDPTPDASS